MGEDRWKKLYEAERSLAIEALRLRNEDADRLRKCRYELWYWRGLTVWFALMWVLERIL